MSLDVLTGSDRSVSDAFAERTLQIVNDGALALMMSIGHRTGLYDIMSCMPASSAGQIAAAAGLSERYVREWLGAMVTGGVVTYDGATDTYVLPPEHAACLTRASSPNNVAVTAQWISVLGSAEDAVVEAFTHGRGVPYGAYGRFHEVQAEESQQTVVDGLLPHILPLAAGLTDRLAAGIDVLDVACGSGRAMISLGQAFPASLFTGVDLSPVVVATANAEAERRGLRNVRFVQDDVAEMSTDQTFDLITAFDAIHDQARPVQVLEAIFQALRPGGTFLMQDIAGHTHIQDNRAHPLGPFLYTISCMHCMSVSLAAGGPGLGAMWGREQALEMLEAAGFRGVRVQALPHDPINIYYVAGKPARRQP